MGKILYFGALTMLAMTLGAGQSQAPARYPNELPGFRFYESHLKPLEPYASDHDTVARVLGSTEVSQTNGWRIQPFFIGKDNDSTITPELVGRLADIEITPMRRVSMLGVKFPKTFTQGGGGIPEINISFDVYRDRIRLGILDPCGRFKVRQKGRPYAHRLRA